MIVVSFNSLLVETSTVDTMSDTFGDVLLDTLNVSTRIVVKGPLTNSFPIVVAGLYVNLFLGSLV